ncbi:MULTISPECIES: GNAT family N-acetyltransferase [unclassified Streptomyces]|uniref:GNAT family N-acetyltransferase n=1 Tax=unclassified Streptomyces TaxID=2593676 RepID=UPI0024E0973C|nr:MULTISPECIES: GNAT family N-acetyltransferase [unclassified Streptomyces]
MSTEARVVLTVDLAVLAPGADGWDVLLVERGTEPYRGVWALPGGKVDRDESPEAAACRELAEEAGLTLERYDLTPLSWYAAPDRDPRGRYVSLAYACLLPERPAVRGGSDAAEARWWPLAPSGLPQLAFDHGTVLSAVRRITPRGCPGPVALRRPVPTDISAIAGLHNCAPDAVGAHAGPCDKDLEDFSARYLHDGSDVVIGSLGGFLLATGALRPAAGDDTGKIEWMRVHPRWRGRGFGGLALEYLEQRGTELGYRRLVLETTEDQHAALALCRRNGYHQTGTATEASLSTLLFEKQL